MEVAEVVMDFDDSSCTTKGLGIKYEEKKRSDECDALGRETGR